jgi:hypothetical protein
MKKSLKKGKSRRNHYPVNDRVKDLLEMTLDLDSGRRTLRKIPEQSQEKQVIRGYTMARW